MKILMVTGSYPPMKCGVGDYSQKLAYALSAIPTVKVDLLTSTDGNSGECRNENEVKTFPVIKKWSLTEAFSILKCIRECAPDIVHIQYPTQGYGKGLLPYFLPIISFLMGKKVVQTWHEGCSLRSVPGFFLKTVVPCKLVVVRPNFVELLHPLLRSVIRNKKYNYIKNASAISKSELTSDEKISLREKYLKNHKRLIVFFGFIYPPKGVELLFEIADQSSDMIVIAGEFEQGSDYRLKVMNCAIANSWVDNVSVTGFLSSTDSADLLAVADAVILPFRNGGGEWNTSIHSAILQSTFVITTSKIKSGYDEKCNVYYARVDDVEEMRMALNAYCGKQRELSSDIDKDEWQQIAIEHYSLYESLLVG